MVLAIPTTCENLKLIGALLKNLTFPFLYHEFQKKKNFKKRLQLSNSKAKKSVSTKKNKIFKSTHYLLYAQNLKSI